MIGTPPVTLKPQRTTPITRKCGPQIPGSRGLCCSPGRRPISFARVSYRNSNPIHLSCRIRWPPALIWHHQRRNIGRGCSAWMRQRNVLTKATKLTNSRATSTCEGRVIVQAVHWTGCLSRRTPQSSPASAVMIKLASVGVTRGKEPRSAPTVCSPSP